jgi:hypothetical protein
MTNKPHNKTLHTDALTGAAELVVGPHARNAKEIENELDFYDARTSANSFAAKML